MVAIAGAEQPAPANPVFSRFDHVLVDEYQETNRVQYELLRLLSDGHRDLVVLSDDDQRIYALRGRRRPLRPPLPRR